jgi:hypothetical protein
MAGTVSLATQPQAMHAVVGLDTPGLTRPVARDIHAVRARRQAHVPVMRPRVDVAHVMAVRAGTPPVVAPQLYGSGRCIMAARRRCVQDLDVGMQAVTVMSSTKYHPWTSKKKPAAS